VPVIAQLLVSLAGILLGSILIWQRAAVARHYKEKAPKIGAPPEAVESATPGTFAFVGVGFIIITSVIGLNGLTKLI
jgi:hypothetical protein